MKTKLLTAIVLTSLAPSLWAVTYNDTITAIFGSGNPNTGWTSETGAGIELALRAKGRNDTSYAGTTPNDGAGTYTFATLQGVRGSFNYEFSINSGTPTLATYDYYLAVDRDSSQGISYSLTDPLLHWMDNSYGSAGTGNGAGVEPTNLLPGDPAGFTLALTTYPTLYTVAQNSQNITFGGATGYPGGALALEADATYSYELFAVAKGTGPTGARLAEVGITVVVGQGGSSVPEGGSTLALLGLGVASMAGFRFRKRVLAA